MQSVAAEEKKAQAFSERFSDAACSKSWLLMSVWSGRRPPAFFAGRGDTAGSGSSEISESGGALLESKSPILLETPNSVWIREGAWMLLYTAVASRPAYL